MSDFAAKQDAKTISELIERDSLKWTEYPGAIGAWVAEMDFGLAPAVSAALEKLQRQELTGYTPNAMREGLCLATVDFVAARYGWRLASDLVHPIADVLSGLSLVMTHWLKPGAKIIVPTPCYMPFLDMPAAYNHELIQLPMLRNQQGWQVDYAGLDAALAGPNSLLVLCNPHNPIGKVYTEAELQKICQIVAKHDALVFSDEIHAPLTYLGHNHVPYASLNDTAAKHCVTAMAASKAFNIAGLKCAQLILTNPDHQEYYLARAHGIPNMPGTSGVAASIAAYRDGRDWLAEVIDYLAGNRQLLGELVAELLPQAGYNAPEGTYLAWLDMNAYQHAGQDRVFDRVLAGGVACNDGIACGAVGDGCLRFNFAMPRPLMAKALRLISDAVK